jgi:dihydrofolate reductase
MSQRLLLTEVDLTVDDADAFFPRFAEAEWHVLRHAVLRDKDPHCLLVERLRIETQE